MDSLPPEVTATITPALVRSLEIPELRRAFIAITEALLAETDRTDGGLARRLEKPLRDLAGRTSPPKSRHSDLTA